MAIAPADASLEHAGSARAPRPSTGLLGAAALVAAASVLPVAYLLIRASQAGVAGVTDALLDARLAALIVRTLALALAVTATTAVLGVTFAWLTERTDLPGARVWTVLLALPLVIPSYVGAYVVLAAFGARGLLTSSIPAPSGFTGAWLVLSVLTYPYVFLSTRSGLRGIDTALEEAARGLGASGRRAFVSVVLPQLRPSIAAGSLLVALYTLHDFGAVSLLRYDTFTRAIFLRYNASFDRTSAAVLALVLVLLSLSVLAMEAATRGPAARRRSRARPPRPAPRARLGRWRAPALITVALPVLAGVALPVGVIFAWLARALDAGITPSLALRPAVNSAQVAVLASLVAVVAAWPVALLSARHTGAAAGTIERASYAGFALPGLVVALALVFFTVRAIPALYQTITILVFAYVVLFLSHAVGPMRASLLRVPTSLDEAAASLGVGRARRIARIFVPLTGPGIITGMALVFLTVMKELPATLLLAPTGFDTLATRVWSVTNAGSFGGAAIPALGLLVLSSGPLAVVLARERTI